MASRDLHNNIHPVPLIAPVAARTDNTPVVSAIIDTAGYESCELVLVTGTNTDSDATFAVLVEDGDNSSLTDNNAVADTFLLGTEADSKLGTDLGLGNDWVVNIVKGVGNYGEAFEKNVGSGSSLKIARGLNALWTKGGLQYAPPIR